MRHALTYFALLSLGLIGAGAFLLWGIGAALLVIGSLCLLLAVYSAERINNAVDAD